MRETKKEGIILCTKVSFTVSQREEWYKFPWRRSAVVVAVIFHSRLCFVAVQIAAHLQLRANGIAFVYCRIDNTVDRLASSCVVAHCQFEIRGVALRV